MKHSPPKYMKIGGHQVKISRKKLDKNIYGQSNSRISEIEYATDLSRTMEASTILHECIHQLLDVFYLNHLLPRKNRESMVLGLEVSLFQFIRENPELIKYIQRS
jgi:hypothetical protein